MTWDSTSLLLDAEWRKILPSVVPAIVRRIPCLYNYYTFETIPSKYSVPFGGDESLNRTRSETTSILGKDAIDDDKYQLVSFHTQTDAGNTIQFPLLRWRRLAGTSSGCRKSIREKQVLINCSVALYLSCRRWKRKVLRQWDNDGSEIQLTKAVPCACRTQDKVHFDSNIKFRRWRCHVPNTTPFHRKF